MEPNTTTPADPPATAPENTTPTTAPDLSSDVAATTSPAAPTTDSAPEVVTPTPSTTPEAPKMEAPEVVAPTVSASAEPAAPAAEPAPTTEAAAPTPAPAPVNDDPSVKKKILLVEDDDGLAQVYMTRLEAENFELRRVPNGEDALASALDFHPDLILLDVMMPKVSGFDVLDILRNTPETANIRIIMLTALSQDSDRDRAKQLGVDDYLVKSQVVIADVIERIKYHLGM